MSSDAAELRLLSDVRRCSALKDQSHHLCFVSLDGQRFHSSTKEVAHRTPYFRRVEHSLYCSIGTLFVAVPADNVHFE